MGEQVIDLGIKFVRGWEPAPPEPTPGTYVSSGLAQTGDFNIALIAGFVLLICAVVGFCAYAIIKNKQFVNGAHVSNSTSTFLNFSNFSLRAKIISAVVTISAIVCFICGCFFINAHAADKESSIIVTPNSITAIIAEDGSVSSWDPSSVTLKNTSTTDKFNFSSCSVSLTEEAKSADALKSATIKITGFNGKVIFDGKAGSTPAIHTDLILDKSASTNLEFAIEGALDVSQIESLFDKSLFKISLNAEEAIPLHDNLYEYTLAELQQASAYLSKHYTEESQDPVCVKFRNFRDDGLTANGSDNGVAMKAEFTNHWAIDNNGLLFTQTGFINDKTAIQARIIGIREDKDASGNSIGLTFMTTHSLSVNKRYESNTTDYAKFGWAGPNEGGKCTLQSFLNSESSSLFPESLVSGVKPAWKGYKFSKSSGKTPDYSFVANKFWAPSMFEMYGQSFETSEAWWPNENEGIQYSAFVKKGITYSSYAPFSNIDKKQDNIGSRVDFVWSRSLQMGKANLACGVNGKKGGSFISADVVGDRGVVACFCI